MDKVEVNDLIVIESTTLYGSPGRPKVGIVTKIDDKWVYYINFNNGIEDVVSETNVTIIHKDGRNV